jgi:hypothetical protein
MIGWLRRLVAGRELAELERWRVECRQVRRWMAEFPDVCTALDHLEAFASGRHYRGLSEVREGMRNRRTIVAPMVANAPGDLDAFERAWKAAYGAAPAISLRTASLADLEAAAVTDWDVAARIEADMQALERAAFVSPPAPAHFDGIGVRS